VQVTGGDPLSDHQSGTGLMIRGDPGRPPGAAALRSDPVTVVGDQSDGVRHREKHSLNSGSTVGFRGEDGCRSLLQFRGAGVDLVEDLRNTSDFTKVGSAAGPRPLRVIPAVHHPTDGRC